jgi:hypothetical protein
LKRKGRILPFQTASRGAPAWTASTPAERT